MNSKIGISSFALKIIAAILMTLDHYALFFIDPGQGNIPVTSYYILRAIGKMSFPIFAYLSVESIYKTKNPKNYLYRLLIFALSLDLIGYITGLILHIPIRNNYILGNAFMDIFLGVWMIYLFNLKNKYSLLAIVPITLAILSIIDTQTDYGTIFKTDWSLYSLVLYLFLYLSRIIAKKYILYKSKIDRADNEVYLELYQDKYNKYISCIGIVSVGLLFYLIFLITGATFFLPGRSTFIPVGTYNVLAIIFILLYNFKLGYSNSKIKYIFYFYYPLHLFVFALISYFTNILIL